MILAKVVLIENYIGEIWVYNNLEKQSFYNFILNNPTEFPDVLVETLFLSNPADEEKVLDPGFQEEMVEKIVQGLEDFLKEAAQ